MCIKKKTKGKVHKKGKFTRKKEEKNKINIIVILRGFVSLSERYEKYLLLKLETKKRERKREKEVTQRNREAECA